MTTAADLIELAETHQPPEHWPADTEAARAEMWRLATAWGARVGLGQLSIDDAYLLCRNASESLHGSTLGAARWRDTMQFATFLVDQAATRAADAVAVADGQALRDLKRIAIAALSRNASDPELRRLIADAAEQRAIAPSIEVLHEAYQGAIAEIRRNAKWVATRRTGP